MKKILFLILSCIIISNCTLNKVVKTHGVQFLEVKQNNEPAKAFYNKMGFKTVGKGSNFYQDGSDALLLKKETIKNHKLNN